MHKQLYASGFLYHSSSQQILLQQNKIDTTTPPIWSLFGGKIEPDESFHSAFQRIIHTTLAIHIDHEGITDVYDYISTESNMNHVIGYAEIAELTDFSPQKDTAFLWVKMKDIYKLPIPVQMKQDITVGRRVIDAKQRGVLDIQSPGEVLLINEA